MQVKRKPKLKPLDAPKEFMRCTPNLLYLIDPTAKADQDAKHMVGDILNQMCRQVIKKANELASRNQTTPNLGTQEVINALKETLGPNMARHAIAEGTRNSLLFLNDRSAYKIEDFVYKVRKIDFQHSEASDAVIAELKETLN
ncbi:hypothetical protein NPIL_557061 [Nephila pilipes]|uniref:Uncharacterized protein n=1 Tax=Nephila pilipes TaxID=299642 RepID=A0A8X6PEV8_NEPPI|nr:hypothetical protein NPIL_557061 [Nephila pilipes]